MHLLFILVELLYACSCSKAIAGDYVLVRFGHAAAPVVVFYQSHTRSVFVAVILPQALRTCECIGLLNCPNSGENGCC